VRQSLSIYSSKDIEHMTTDDGRVTADCQFCGAHYELDPANARVRGRGSCANRFV
jgi:molecular chaperone Hsp33